MAESLDAVEQIADPEARVRAMSATMAEQTKRAPEWKKQRRDLVLRLRAEKVSVRQIAERIGTSASTVQDIIRGYSGSGSKRPKAAPPTADGESSDG